LIGRTVSQLISGISIDLLYVIERSIERSGRIDSYISGRQSKGNNHKLLSYYPTYHFSEYKYYPDVYLNIDIS
jgi:hypothetical protein